MLMINDLIANIKSRINIIELAKSEGLTLKKQSKRLYKTTCCFHNEKKASLTFYADTNTFNCFACQTHGDAINFYAKRHNLSNGDAIKQLAGQFGLQGHARGQNLAGGGGLTATGGQNDRTGLNSDQKRFKTDPDGVFRALKDFCGGIDQESQTYLTSESRGLTNETIKQFGLFSISDYKKAREFLLGKFALEALRELVLFDGKNRFLFTRHKIVIPIIEDGKIVALRGRYFYKGFSDPDSFKTTFSYGKYQSTAGVRDRLFNGDILKTLKKGERVYLCEGEFDTIITQQHGHNAVGVLGVSNYSDGTIKRLNDFDLVIAFDNDERGRAEALKISNIFYKQTGREVIREKLPEGVKDLTELFIYKAKQNANI